MQFNTYKLTNCFQQVQQPFGSRCQRTCRTASSSTTTSSSTATRPTATRRSASRDSSCRSAAILISVRDSGKVRGTSAALGHPRGLKLAKFCKFRKKWRVKSERKFEKTKKGRMKRCPIHQQTRHKNEPKGRDNSHEGSCY